MIFLLQSTIIGLPLVNETQKLCTYISVCLYKRAHSCFGNKSSYNRYRRVFPLGN